MSDVISAPAPPAVQGPLARRAVAGELVEFEPRHVLQIVRPPGPGEEPGVQTEGRADA